MSQTTYCSTVNLMYPVNPDLRLMSKKSTPKKLKFLKVQVEPDEGQKLREQQLRQYSFFQLRIHLKRGQNLIAMDKNGTSDPYVKFKVAGRLLHKSRIVYRDLNPVWDECFTVPIEDPFLPVQLKVFDYDWGLQDDFMGVCHLDLTALELGRSQDLVLCLRDPNKPTNQDLGEIVLNVTLYPKSQEDKEQVKWDVLPVTYK
ncbi:Multiple C2 and transmembrane domain-containing protein 2 [Danaus plexippus plexippus]|uniref:Multiple C2 and transmembrane domain-containing protein 2 n=1 Tax=Danaus plexippus plexippus TaxID=278856 RepID=A0A212F330_DANPL|nr:Multiple C2 and transmembrane domain-containing protein 2 [Danaus plexippus plexippus]